MKPIFKNKNIVSLMLAIIIFIFLAFISYIWVWKGLNFDLKDYYYKIDNTMTEKVNDSIVVVEIDDKTQQELWRFPFNRKIYSNVLNNINEKWASVIWIDIIFPDKTTAIDDFIFSTAIKRAWNVILWYYLDTSSKSIKWPLEVLDKSSYYRWLLNPPVEKITQKIYFIWPLSKFNNVSIESFGLSVLKAYYSKLYSDISILELWDRNSLEEYALIKSKNLSIPLSWENWNFMFSYNSPDKFQKISFVDAYNWKLPDLDWKIVLIWPAADWLQDDFYTPIGRIYWVYIHANVINSVLEKNYFTMFDLKIEYFILFLMLILAIYINLMAYASRLILWNFVILFIFSLLFPITYYFNIIINNPLYFVLWAFISIVVSNIIKYINEDNNKNKLLKSLWEYVSKDIAKSILSDNWAIKLDWENKKVSIMFSDIEWFTTISENMSPEELVSYIRDYLSEMTNVIVDNKWYVDKYEWDAIMALWWVFWAAREVDNVNHCLQSILKQNEKLKELNSFFEREWRPKISVRFWVNFWEAILWNIWVAWKKIQFTAMWDNVNIASRLEWINKIYWTNIIVSGSVYDITSDFYEYRYLDKVKVKWKDKSVDIYELVWEKWKVNQYKHEIISEFKIAMDYYLSWEYETAKISFDKLIHMWDKPSMEFSRRCEKKLNEEKRA